MTTKVQHSSTRPTHTHQRTQSAVSTPSTAARGVQHPLLASNNIWQGGPEFSRQLRAEPTKALPLLPNDHPHAHRPLTAFNDNGSQPRSSSMKRNQQVDASTERPSAPHKRGKSTLSLKGLAAKVNGKENDKSEEREKDAGKEKPKKSKSSTNLASLLSRPKSSGKSPTKELAQPKDKENVTPPGSAVVAPPTPIWAQFATQPLECIESTRKVPLNDGLYGQPKLYDSYGALPLKPNTSHDDERPTLKSRPRSTYGGYANATKSAFAETVAGLRKPSSGQNKQDSAKDEALKERQSRESPTKAQQSNSKPIGKQLAIETSLPRVKTASKDLEVSQTPSRVKAAVAAWDDKSKKPRPSSKDVTLDSEAIATEFESLLDAQNIAPDIRDKMRNLSTSIKADFIKKKAYGSASSTESLAMNVMPKQTPSSRPGTAGKHKSGETSSPIAEQVEPIEDATAGKKSRPRSLTFTSFRKGDSSPTKKQKSDRATSNGRPKSADLSGAGPILKSVFSKEGLRASSAKSAQPPVPEDFVSYLRKVQKPELVEVGRLHKLRQLLRNEAVSWVDEFITQEGMTEIIGLLYRIIEVEWREEHEDALLHETLLCLKALSTTSLALAQLDTLSPTLFPTLLKLLFSEDKKGPSEFTTRTIVISLLSTHLSTAPTVSRAKTLLSYLQDQRPSDENARPLEWIETMRVSRPYKVWHREISNVGKEVFWIFLHNLNVIPYPDPASSSLEASPSLPPYTATHYPAPRPPVPAAPYVGGVEWEATNYLAAHLDLLNALIACTPTRAERNRLRQELRDSGFEKVMGGTLRTCKEKFYGAVHAGLSTWIGAAREDGWDFVPVKDGPRRDDSRARSVSPKKKDREVAPKLEIPQLDLGVVSRDGGGWL